MLFFGMSLCFACSLHRDFGQGYAGGYAQFFGNAYKPIEDEKVMFLRILQCQPWLETMSILLSSLCFPFNPCDDFGKGYAGGNADFF